MGYKYKGFHSWVSSKVALASAWFELHMVMSERVLL